MPVNMDLETTYINTIHTRGMETESERVPKQHGSADRGRAVSWRTNPRAALRSPS
jgi:hypothetical protein